MELVLEGLLGSYRNHTCTPLGIESVRSSQATTAFLIAFGDLLGAIIVLSIFLPYPGTPGLGILVSVLPIISATHNDCILVGNAGNA
jgi:hypothetical protein